MLLREIAEQHGDTLAARQTAGDAFGLLRSHGLGDLRQRLDQRIGRDDGLVRDLHQQFVVRGMDDVDLCAMLHGLADACRQQRMILAQEAADDQQAVGAADVSDGHAQPGRALLLGIGAEIGLAQAEIDVVAADAAHEFLQQVEFFQCGVGRGQRTDLLGAGTVGDVAQTVGGVFQRNLPFHFLPLAVLLDHRLGQALGGIQSFIGEAVAVGQPAFVDVFVLDGQHAHHAVVLGLHGEIGTQAVVRAHRAAARQFPAACLVAERLAGQRADRAQVDHVARQFGVHRAGDEGHDLGVLTAEGLAQFHHPGDLRAEAHATGAVDAAAHLFGRDQRTDILAQHHALLFLIARMSGAVTYRHVLQHALAALVADRAIQRMVHQQELHHALLRFHRLLGVRVHLHALGHRRGTGRQRLGRFFHLHQAHAAVGGDGQFLVVAEMRDRDSRLMCGLDHGGTACRLDLLAVDFDVNHCSPIPFSLTPGNACARCDIRIPCGSA